MPTILVPPQFSPNHPPDGEPSGFVAASFSDFFYSLGCSTASLIPPTSAFNTAQPSGDEASRADTLLTALSPILDFVDALFLQGGNDIDPALYQEPCIGAVSLQPWRDAFEIELISEAIKRGMPIFGVCRGFQLLNAYFGGSLVQHLEGSPLCQHRDPITIDRPAEEYLYHPVQLSPGGIFHDLLNTDTVSVSSIHHQGVRTLGNGLALEASAADGLVEAFSYKERGIIGVQWHPEADFSMSAHGEPVKWWVKECVSAYAAKRLS